jgi:hexosaminidase
MKATMDPTKESTYTFLDRLFQEMTPLFPDRYFHIGGDEVEGSQWSESLSIREFMTKHNLVSNRDLQAHFNARVHTMLKKYGKIVVGWEEILGDLPVESDAVIQSWRTRESLTDAAQKGYRALLSHGYYLDHLTSSLSHSKVDPIYEDELQLLDREQRSRILGGEACMWSEYVSQDSVDSRLWPRALAIAERLWSHSPASDFKFLYERLFRMNRLLDKVPTGVTHLSSYRSRLQKLIVDEKKKQELLHPFVILADVCEPVGMSGRAATSRYTSTTSLTTFADVLQSESEQVWRVQNLPIDKTLTDVFHTWSLSYIRLKSLFDDTSTSDAEQVWGQDLEQLAKNLASVGTIGLRILQYREKKVLHPDKDNIMNTWTFPHWITYHYDALNELENQVAEVRLAAVRPVRRLLGSVIYDT